MTEARDELLGRPTTSPSTPSRYGRSTPSTPASRCWWRRRPAPGKTVVAEYAVALALAAGARSSTPRRSRRSRTRSTATSSAATAPDNVGLLTGDNAINGDAPIVVMTTEVLRNMIYAGVAGARRPALRRARRGALPAGHLPRAGVGGGDPPPADRRAPRVPVGHRLERRGAGRLDHDGARADGRGDRGPPAGRARQPLLRRRPLVARAAPAADPRRRPAQPRGQPARRRVAARSADAGSTAAGGSSRRDASRSSSGCPTRTCCRRSSSSSAGRPATTPSTPASPPACGSRTPTSGPGSARSPSATSSAVRRRPRRARLRPLAGRARAGHRRPPRRDGAALQGGGRGVLRGGS